MLLDIDRGVFVPERVEHHTAVWHVLDLVAKGRHEWRPTSRVVMAAEDFLGKVWPKTKVLTELAWKCFEESANPPPPALATATVTAECLADAVADLTQPAALVVEDGINEESFLLGVARAFGYHRIVEAADRQNGWLRVIHAGGKDRMALFVEGERERFRVLVRVAAVLDSDCDQPGAVAERNRRELEKIQAIDGITEVHMWAWREPENYLPVKVWVDRLPHRAAEAAVVASMGPLERGYVDMKAIVGRPRPLIPDQMRLTEEDFAELGPDAVDELKAVLNMISRIL
jgi:hypothetical protein